MAGLADAAELVIDGGPRLFLWVDREHETCRRACRATAATTNGRADRLRRCFAGVRPEDRQSLLRNWDSARTKSRGVQIPQAVAADQYGLSMGTGATPHHFDPVTGRRQASSRCATPCAYLRGHRQRRIQWTLGGQANSSCGVRPGAQPSNGSNDDRLRATRRVSVILTGPSAAD